MKSAARRTFWILLGLIALSAGLTWLMAREQHDELGTINERLRLIQRHEATINENVERARLGLQLHYDDLVDGVRSIDDILARLHRDFALLSGGEDQGLDKALRDYAEAFEKKKREVEDFKSNNAVYRNSLLFLPHVNKTFIDALRGGTKGGERLVHDSMVVLSESLSMVSGNADYDKAAYAGALRRLNAALTTLPQPAAGTLRGFLRHNEILHQTYKRTSELIERILGAETVARAPILSAAFDAYQITRRTQVAVQRHVLISGAVFLLGLIVLLLWRQSKHQANLEWNVEKRTAALAALHVAKMEAERAAAAAEAATSDAIAANRAKSQFLANMSHELRTPLNAIMGFSEIIGSEMLGPMGNTKYRDYVTDIHGSAQHLLELINDILDLAKIQDGKVVLHEEAVDVAEAVGFCLLLLKERAETAGVNLKSEFSSGLPPLYVEARKLKQILINLLSNAIKFTPARGKVTIKTWFRPDDGLVFQVADTGIGIALEDIPKALAPFRQIDSDLNRKYEGAGLGLPLAKALTELHGGSLDLQSEVGVGTTVTVRFPAERIVLEAATGT